MLYKTLFWLNLFMASLVSILLGYFMLANNYHPIFIIFFIPIVVATVYYFALPMFDKYKR